MADVTGTIGSEPVELNNAATEATLRAMLAALNKQTAVISSLKGSLGGGGGGGGNNAQTQALQQETKATKDQTQATKEETVATEHATESMSRLAKGAMFLGGVLGDLIGGAVKTASNLTDLAGSMMDGQGKISDFYGALKDLPLGLGLVAGLFEKIAKMQQAELDTYRTMTKAGVNFGGQLNTIRQTALDLGMTLDEFAGFVTKNSNALHRMGGDVEEGAQNFVKLSKDLRNSQMGADLRALGFTTQEVNDGLANYIEATGGRSAQEMKDTKALSQGAGEYLKQLDALAEMTGQSREELEKQQKEASQDAAYQMALAGKTEEEKKKAAAALAEMQAKYGKAGADAFKAKFLGMPPISEQAQALTATVNGFDKALGGVVNDVHDNSKGMKDVNKGLTNVSQTVGKAGKEMGPQMTYALAQGGGALSEAATTMAKHANELDKQGATSAEKEMALRERIGKEQEARERSAAANAAESEKAFKDMGASIYGALQPAIAMLTPIVNDLANEFMGFVKSNMPAIKEAITKFATFITNFAKDLFSEDGQKKIINDITYYLKLMLIEIKKAILPKIMYDDKDAAKERAQLDAQKEAYDAKAEQTRLSVDAEKRNLALSLDGNKAEQEKTAQQVKASKEAIDNANEQLKAGKITKEQYEEIRKKEQASIDVKNSALNLLDAEGKLNEEKKAKLQKEQDTLKNSGEVDAKMAKVKEQEVKDKSNQGTVAGNAAGMAVGAGAGAVGGAVGGGVAGAWAGGIIGSLAGPVGTILGASIGSEIGVWLGGAGGVVLGGLLGKTIGDKMSAPTESAVRKEMEEKENKGKEIGKKAGGGPTDANTPYLVGENGPEIFFSKQAGDILSNSAMKNLGKDKGPDMKSHMQDMTKNLSGNFKGLTDDMIGSQNQKQDITLSKETLVSFSKVFQSDFMPKMQPQPGTKDPQLASQAVLDEMNKKFKDLPPIPKSLMMDDKMQDPTALRDKISMEQSGRTQMQPDMFKSLTDTLLPGFMNKLPSVGDLGKKADEAIKDPKALKDMFDKTMGDDFKNLFGLGDKKEKSDAQTAVPAANENMLKEMQTLNKQTADLVKYMKATLDENKTQTTKLGSLSGNLYV